MDLFKKTLGFLWNRYVIAFLVFVFFVLILGPNNLRTQYRLSKVEEDIRNERQFYLDEIEKNRKISEELMTNLDNLERFAREKYWMKRDNEDVYLIIRREEGDSKKTK
ncbi:MAG: septum formation initiator family protein [Bacteroidetes bacterium]|nr:MAG: septum formation initiator family protein [Bacteroidota bacterium]